MKKWLFGLLILTILSGVTGGYLVASIKKGFYFSETYVFAETGDHKALEGLEIETQDLDDGEGDSVGIRKTVFVKKGIFVPDSERKELDKSRSLANAFPLADGDVYTEVSIEGVEEHRNITVKDSASGEQLFRFELGNKDTNQAVCIGGENCGMVYLPITRKIYAIFRTDAGIWKTDEYSADKAASWVPGKDLRKTVAYDGSRLAIVYASGGIYGNIRITVLRNGRLIFWGIVTSPHIALDTADFAVARFR